MGHPSLEVKVKNKFKIRFKIKFRAKPNRGHPPLVEAERGTKEPTFALRKCGRDEHGAPALRVKIEFKIQFKSEFDAGVELRASDQTGTKVPTFALPKMGHPRSKSKANSKSKTMIVEFVTMPPRDGISVF